MKKTLILIIALSMSVLSMARNPRVAAKSVAVEKTNRIASVVGDVTRAEYRQLVNLFVAAETESRVDVRREMTMILGERRMAIWRNHMRREHIAARPSMRHHHKASCSASKPIKKHDPRNDRHEHVEHGRPHHNR